MTQLYKKNDINSNPANKLTEIWNKLLPQTVNITMQYNNRVYVCEHKYVLCPTQTHFSPSRQAAFTLEGIEKIKTEKKMTAKQSEEYFFLQRCVRKRRRAQDMGGLCHRHHIGAQNKREQSLLGI